MPLQNDFLSFAAASGSNVLAQSTYAAASATATGYVTGVASAPAINKTLRQTTLITSMVANFIVDKAVQPVVDDGTISTIEANFVTAIQNVAGTRIIQITDVVNLTTALNGKLSTTGNAASASQLQTARTITLTGQVNGGVNFDGSGNVNLNCTVPVGALSISNTAGLQSSLSALAPINNASLTGTTNAEAINVNGSPVVTQAGFSTVSDSNGSATKFPDGTIIARGIMDRTSSTTQITFPAGSGFTQAPVVVATPINNITTPSGYTFTVAFPTLTGIQVHQSGTLSCYWTAIGR
jgi:hypothetical protein